MHERIRHEHQTPMFSNGFSVAHAILIQAQMAFPVLIKGFNWPALHIQGHNPLRMPVHPIGHQHDIRARHLRTFETHHQPHFAQAGQTHRQGKRPIGFVPHGHRPIRARRDERDEVFHSHVRPYQADRLPRCILQDKAVGLQVPVLLQQANPVFFPVAGHGHQLFREIPTVKHEDAKRELMLNGRFQ